MRRRAGRRSQSGRASRTPASRIDAAEQTPLEQDLPGEQTVPQVPQLFRSTDVSAHLPDQDVVGGGHAHKLVPHVAPPVQVMPQLPQLFGSSVTSIQARAQRRSGTLQPIEH
jgi:hypothetical protein